MLHTISESTIDIEMIGANDAVLFWQSGVILALRDNIILKEILNKTKHCYILDNDVVARGLTALIDERLQRINMDEVVKLTEIYYPQMKW